MQKVLVSINQNLMTLHAKFGEMVFMVYDKQVKKLLEKFVSKMSVRFFDIIHAVERLNVKKATGLLLEMVEEADAMMDSLAWRVASKKFEKISHVIRELLQVLRSEVIFLDQYVQSRFVFF
ncbi:MAG: hypothetical protein JSS76_12595 [Bacteroidetes bacterium]|nr:hypothetical protein [Bacteroidota bacterium]MBS1685591.1 hypothetical protein [Bacteroidota bacterium]